MSDYGIDSSASPMAGKRPPPLNLSQDEGETEEGSDSDDDEQYSVGDEMAAMDEDIAHHKNNSPQKKKKQEVAVCAEEEGDELSTALAYIRSQRELLKTGNPAVIEEESRMKAWVEMDELEVLLQEELLQRSVRRWMWFDCFFGFVIIMNGVVLGIQTQGIVDETSAAAKTLELSFLLLFTIEFVVRWRYKPTGFRGLMKDTWTRFDFIIICVTFLDVVVLGLFDTRPGGLPRGANLLTTLKIVRLFRLVRLVRLLKLLKKLWMIVSGMSESFRILFWSLAMMLLFCYVFGLFALELVRSSDMSELPESKEYWGNVLACVLSMAEIATHNSQKPLALLSEANVLAVPVAVLFLFSASLGLLNLSIAVQMTSSLNIAKQDDLYEDIIERLIKHRALRRLREMLAQRCLAHTGSLHVSRDMLLTWVQDEREEALPDSPTRPERPQERQEQKDKQPREGSGDLRSAAMNNRSGTDKSGFSDRSGLTTASGYTVASSSDKDSPAKVPPAATASNANNARALQKSASFKASLLKTKKHKDKHNKLNKISEKIFRGEKKRTSDKADVLDFSSAGLTEGDIQMIFDEIGLINGFEKSITVDEFIESSMMMKGRIHVLDLVSWTRTLCTLYNRLLLMKQSLADTHRALEESSDQVKTLLQRYHVAKTGEHLEAEGTVDSIVKEGTDEIMVMDATEWEKEQDREVEEAERKHLTFRHEQEAIFAQQEYNRIMRMSNWCNFDLAFSLVVGLNTLVLGIESATNPTISRNVFSSDFNNHDLIWFLVDFWFVFMYVLEFCLRTIFHYQMEIQNDYRTMHGWFPKLAVFMDREVATQVVLYTPRWIKNPRTFMCVDLLAIVTGLVDNILLRVVYTDPGYSKALKLVGLLRLMRVLRLLHLVRPLTALVGAFVANVKIIAWSLAMLVCMIYAGAIAMVQLMGEQQLDDEMKKYWGGLGTSMLTLSEMVTFSNWQKHLYSIWNTSFVIWFGCMGFMVVTSLGMLNLVTGVMVQVAFSTVLNLNLNDMKHRLMDGKVSIQEAVERAFFKEGKRRDHDKDEMQKRIAELRQELKEKEAANQAQEQTFSGTAAASRMRRSRLQSDPDVTLPMNPAAGIPVLETDEGGVTKKKQQIQRPTCWMSDRTHCIVNAAFWTSNGELCLNVTAQQDSRANQHDPMTSAVIWDNGRCNPTLFVLDKAAVESMAKLQFLEEEATTDTTGSQGGKPEGAHHKPSSHGKRSYQIGNLFFGKVPMTSDLFFQFNIGYSKAQVFPLKPSAPWAHELFLADITPVETDTLSVRELRCLMQDPIFSRKLEKINLRPEQVYMTYATMNVNCIGKVKVPDFIDGLMRLRRSDLGLDTAAAKSLMRRLMTQVADLSREAVTCHMCFSSAVQKLRGVNILDHNDTDDTYVIDEEMLLEERQHTMAKENRIFRAKVDRLSLFVQKKKAKWNNCNLLGFEREFDDNDSSQPSITSASPGWD